MHRAVGPSQSTLRPLLLLEHCANIHLKREDLGNSLCLFLKHCFLYLATKLDKEMLDKSKFVALHLNS